MYSIQKWRKGKVSYQKLKIPRYQIGLAAKLLPLAYGRQKAIHATAARVMTTRSGARTKRHERFASPRTIYALYEAASGT